MKLLVIPDVHLKPWMFDRAHELLQANSELGCVCLGDIPDDFNKQYSLELYDDTFNRAIQFAELHPDTYWCYGNHECSYLWKYQETGYSYTAEYLVRMKLSELENTVGDHKLKICHLIDTTLFSHAGLSQVFAFNVAANLTWSKNIEHVVKETNEAPAQLLWGDFSPIWFRPQLQTRVPTYYPRKLLQVVGHTPVKKPYKLHGILSCDTFSTHRNGTPYGTEEFVIVDTVTHEWSTIK